MFLVLDVIWYVVFLLSTTCHEAAHALAAELGGNLTGVHAGPVSLDPIPQVRRVPFGIIAAVPLRPLERNGGLKRHFVRVDLMGKRYGVARYLFTKGPNGGSFSVGKFFC